MHNLFLPKVRFDFDDDPDPHKRMKKNMKKAYKMLKPARKLLMPCYQSTMTKVCVVTGVDLRMLGAEATSHYLTQIHYNAWMIELYLRSSSKTQSQRHQDCLLLIRMSIGVPLVHHTVLIYFKSIGCIRNGNIIKWKCKELPNFLRSRKSL